MISVKNIRGTAILLLIGLCLIFFSGCANTELSEEEKLVNSAKKELAALKSGVITVTNNLNGEVEQTFTFRYDEVGVLSWCLTGVTDGKPYYSFSNGYETYTIENGVYTFCKKGEQEFQMFTSDVRHPMTDEDYIFYEKAAVKSSSLETDGSRSDNGSRTVYSCEYEPKAISGDDALGKLTEFSVVYTFEEGKLSFFEQNSSYEKNGQNRSFSYRIEISSKNSVEKVEMPEEIRLQKEATANDH